MLRVFVRNVLVWRFRVNACRRGGSGGPDAVFGRFRLQVGAMNVPENVAAPRLPWRLRLVNWFRRRVRHWFQWRAPANPAVDANTLTWQQSRVVKIVAGLIPAHRLPPFVLRRAYRISTTPFHIDAVPVRNCRNLRLDSGLRLRIYTPASAAVSGAPALMFYHGGGCVIGDLETHDTLCRHLANQSEQHVIAVDYRLAPRHRFPAQALDAIEAFNWVAGEAASLGIDVNRLGVGGDSAGGYLSTLLCQQALNPTLGGRPARMPAYQWLVYPAVDFREEAVTGGFPSGVVLTDELMRYFGEHVIPPGLDVTRPDVSPLLAESLAGMPRGMVLTVGHDPLCMQGCNYVERLRGAGVATTHLHFPRLMHEFVSMGGVCPDSRAALGVASETLRDLAWADTYT
jgi:acetyl esterase